MMYHLYSASPKLSLFVDSYWESNFATSIDTAYNELFVAQLNANIIVNLSEAYLRNDATVNRSTLNTINTSAIKFVHQASNHLFGIRFKPAGLTMFTSLGLDELKDTSICLQDIFGSDAIWFETAIYEGKNVQERIEITEKFLMLKIKEKNLERYVFSAAIQDSIAKHFYKPNCIAEVVEELNTTHRTFDRNFKSFLGLSPKKMHRMIRFQKVFEMLHVSYLKKQSFDFYQCGYYDQAHFSKEFKEFTGMTLQAYLDSPYFVQNIQDNHFL
ncbi:MAG: AraC family transcriptional regulator [Runella slithyformis]|nr:MAG: AraC family transcriptional regulator [Runella slithyformis]